MERDTYLVIKEEGNEKKRSKKLDWIIYGLAVISFVLMVIVIVHNNKTSIEILEPEKTAVVQKQEKQITQSQVQEDLLAKQKEAETQKQLLAQKQLEQQKASALEKKETPIVQKTELPKETIKKEEVKKPVTAPVEKVEAKIETKKTEPIQSVSGTKGKPSFSGNYNWKALKRYSVKPDANLTVVTSYTVQKGDAFWKIAEKMNVKTINIIAVNADINNPNYILPGQVILIPNK